jgi:hypothetical protein
MVSDLNEVHVRDGHTPVTVRALSSTRAAKHELCEGHRETGKTCGGSPERKPFGGRSGNGGEEGYFLETRAVGILLVLLFKLNRCSKISTR